jgi:hypothetical protein
VPCCETCRSEQSADDEVFRLTILNAQGVEKHPEARQAIAAMFRSFDKPRKRGFRTFVNRSLELLEVTTEAGMFLGHQPSIKIEQARVNRVGQRIVRGLFFHEQGEPLPPDYEVIFALQQLRNPGLEKSLAGFRFPTPKYPQGKVFAYTWVAVPEDRWSSIWFMVFFETLACLGFTRKCVPSGNAGRNVG